MGRCRSSATARGREASALSDVAAVIFDYYETLAELSYAMRERAFDDLARSIGLDLPPGEAYRHWRERTPSDAVLRLGGTARPPFDGPAQPFVSFREVWRRRCAELFREWCVEAPPDLGVEAYVAAHAGAALYPDVLPAIAALRGRCWLAVLSDADGEFLAGSMERNELAVDLVIASDEVGVYKPHVTFFREGCDRLGVAPSRAVYVGDSPWADIAGARNAGLRAIWLNRHSAAWPDDIEPPETAIASLGELAAALV
jgi:2-haloalkanoic acid dehalogenase type II